LAPLQTAQALVGFGAIAAFTRLMSAEEFGQYALALSISMFAHTLVFTWAEAAAFRFFAAAHTEHKLADHFATLRVLAIVLGGGALIATAAMLWLADLREDIAALSALAGGAATFRFLTRIGRESERAAFEFARFAAAETIYLLLGFGVGVALLLRFDLGPAAPFAGLLLAGAMVCLVDALRLAARAKGGAVSAARALNYANYGAPLALALALDLGVQAVCRVILAGAAGAEAIGSYAAAFGLARPLDLMFMSVSATFAPAILTAYEQHGAHAARTTAQSAFITLAAIATPAAIGLAFVAEPLSALMVGETLRAEAARALPWLALAGLISGFNLYYWSEAFQLTRRTGLRAVLLVMPGIAQIALTAALAPHFGAQGAAGAALAGACLAALALITFGGRLIALPAPLLDLARVAGATGVMATALAMLPQAPGAASLAIEISAGMLAYSLGAIAFNVFGSRGRVMAACKALAARAPCTEQSHAR
jgi:O-antigen/teichoic acid export membrane protein